ncbi:MAG: hypothetical protein AAFS10_19080 [Myxococcota bacterium]
MTTTTPRRHSPTTFLVSLRWGALLLASVWTALVLWAPGQASADESLQPSVTSPTTLGPLPQDAVAVPKAEEWPTMDTEGLVRIDTPDLQIWSVPEAAGTMRRIAPGAEADLMRIRRTLGAPEGNPRIRVVVLRALNDYFTRRGTRPRAPAWAVGLALSQESTVLLLHGRNPTGQPVNLRDTLVHELAHIALERTVGEPLGHAHGPARIDVTQKGLPRERKVPRWLHEGFAIWAAGEWTLERSTTLIEGGVSGTIMPLTHLRNGFPPDGFAVELAYAESYHFLHHLHTQYGEGAFRELMARMREGETFDAAFEAAYGERFGNVESAWRRGLKMNYAWVPTLLGSTAFLGFGALLLVLAWRRRRTHMKARMETMDEGSQGAPHPPLPGFGLSEQDVRPRPWRVLRDGTVVPRYDGPLQVMTQEHDEDDDGLYRDDDIILGEDGIPRTSDGFTIH